MAKANPLQEQLLKAGLVKKSQVSQAAREQVKARHGKAPVAPTDSQREADRLRAEKAERDRAIEAERKEKSRQQELQAQVRQIIESNRVKREGESEYRFNDGTVIRTLLVNAVLRRQLAAQLPPALIEENERILGKLEQGELAGEVPPVLAALYRPSVQPYLVSQFRYLPAERIAALALPVLIVQGTTDIQVNQDDARALKAAHPQARLEIVEGMNHVLKLVPPGPAQLPSYADPALPLAPALVAAVTGFLTR